MRKGAKAVALLKQRVRRSLTRRRFVKSIRPSDVFIVTYPRSGTTWLRYLIANIMNADSREDITFRSFRDYAPDINDLYAAQGTLDEYVSLPDPRLFSIHARYDAHFPHVVYVLRDPRDVMVSYYHYRLKRERTYGGSLQEFLKSDDHYPCRWDEHVAGWLLNGVKANVCLVRYEDMQRDTHGALKRVLTFAGVPYSEAALSRAVEASRFEQMRSAEEQYSAGTPQMRDEHAQFVRRGKIAGYVDELDVQSIRIIEEKYGAVMRIVGYEPSG